MTWNRHIGLLAAVLLLSWNAQAIEATSVQQDIRTHALTSPETILHGIYEKNHFSPLWYGSPELNRRRENLRQAMSHRDTHGLPADPECTSARTPDPGSAKDLGTADIALSRCLLRLHHDISRGMATIADLGRDWFLSAEAPDLSDEDVADFLAGEVNSLLSRAAPQSRQYQDLRDFLLTYLGLKKRGGWSAIDGSHEVLFDGTDPRRASVLARLRAEGYLPQGGDVTSESLGDAIREFQARNGLESDGRVGKRTLAAMNVTVAQRIVQIAVNMERWRHIPRAFEPAHIEVNVADASLVLTQPNSPPARLRTIIGDRNHPTPAFRTVITGVTVNPSWTIPASIASRELLPKLKRSPKYLLENEITIVDNTADPYGMNIDWRRYSRGHFPYQLRQRPGSKNPLGLVKFEMANPFDVYIHDTPAKSLFALPRRGLSHGCIRVENPESLATRLLPHMSEQEIRDAIGSGATQTLPLSQPLPVYVLYWTAFVDSAGQLNVRDDIYSRDVAIAKALRFDGTAARPESNQLENNDNCLPTT